MPAHHPPYFIVAFETGARTSELPALTRDPLDRKAGTLLIDAARVRGIDKGTKTGNTRVVHLTQAAISTLRELPTRFSRGHVFLAYDGQPYQKAKHINRLGWTPALKVSGVRWHRAYNCRHTRASLGLMAGQNPAFLSRQLGHSLAIFLSTYARWMDGAQDRLEMDKLNKQL